MDETENVENIHIGSLVQFIDQILNIENENQQNIFYRGHSNENYLLEPSLFRKNNKNQPKYCNQEHILYRELYMSEYKEFINDKYTLDKLVRMQHYSMPTRLLDLT